MMFVGLRELCALCEGDVRAVNLLASEAADPLTHRSFMDALIPEGENKALLSFYL